MNIRKYARIALIALSIIALPNCAGNATSAAITPAGVQAKSNIGKMVTARVSGGTPDSGIAATISDESFKTAIESSLVKSGLFRSIGSNDYELSAFIVTIKQPIAGLSMTVSMEVSYNLRKAGSLIWADTISSTYKAPLGDAFVGAVRLRKATEGAARENIRKLVVALDEKF